VRSLLLGERTDERARRKGAHGERFAGFILGRLPEGWHVFHDMFSAGEISESRRFAVADDVWMIGREWLRDRVGALTPAQRSA
jgi:hypothetical protein